jgi:site-specific recombinase XerD
VFEFAIRNGWAIENPCRRIDRPKAVGDEDIRYLDADEIEALLQAVPDDDFGRVQRGSTSPR